MFLEKKKIFLLNLTEILMIIIFLKFKLEERKMNLFLFLNEM